MASLDAFLADLDDLQEEENDAVDDEEDGFGGEEGAGDDDDDDLDMMADDEPKAASGLLHSTQMTELMERVEAGMDGVFITTTGAGGSSGGGEDEDAEYALIVACNEMVIDVNNEIEAIAKTIKDEYARRFPELDSLILNPLDYARVVLKLGNEIDLSDVDLTGILPSATIMVVTVTASTTIGTPLPEQTLAAVIESCEQVLTLADNKQKMLAFVESRMTTVAPNLSNLVGPAIAAKLIGAAGGLHKLAALPSTVLQILGSKKKSLGGMSSTGALGMVVHGGFIASCDLVSNTPPALRNKVSRPGPRQWGDPPASARLP